MGEHEQGAELTPLTPNPTNKHTNPCTFPLGCHKTLESFPQVASAAESHRAGKHIMSVFVRLFSLLWFSAHYWRPAFAGVCVCVCVFVHIQRTLLTCEGLCWGVYPPGPEPLGPIRGCKYFMRYDSTAQTLLNHRPLTIFSGYVPFGKVRNNEINKHSLPPVTARALRGLYAARLLMRGSVQFPSCRKGGGGGKKTLANTARLARLAANQLPDKTLPESAHLDRFC